MNNDETTLWRRHFGVIMTALVSLVAALISATQILTTYIVKDNELEIARIHNNAEDERQWKVALLQFISTNKDGLFSKNFDERQQVLAILDVSFPAKYAEPIHNKLTVLNAAYESPPKKTVFDELLEPLIRYLDTTKSAFDRWDVKALYDNNIAARSLLLRKAYLTPPELRSDALRLVEHYDAWIGEYEKRSQAKSSLDVPFGAVGYPFPHDAESHFREVYNQYAKDSNR